MISSTKDIPVPEKLVDQVLGQDEAVRMIKKAAKQRRHVLLIGEPGTGKCVGKDTLICTTSGPLRAEDLFHNFASIEASVGEERYAVPSKEIMVQALDQRGRLTSQKIKQMYKGIRKKAFHVTTSSGAEIVISGDHPILTLKNGQLTFAPSDELSEGEWIALARTLAFQSQPQNAREPQPYQYVGKNKSKSLSIKIPALLDFSLGYFLGLYIAEGRWQGNMKIYNQNKHLQQHIKDTLIRVFEYPAEFIELNHNEVYVRRSRSLIEVLNKFYQVPIETTKQSSKKQVPQEIFSAPPEVAAAFLSGYIDGDGYISKSRGLQCVSSSKLLIEQIRLLLLRWGIHSRVRQTEKYASNTIRKRRKIYYSLTVRDGKSLSCLASVLTLNVVHKRENLQSYCTKKTNTNVDVIPNLGDSFSRIKQKSHLSYDQLNLYPATLGKIKRRERQISRTLAQELVARFKQTAPTGTVCITTELEELEKLATTDIFWDRISSLTITEEDMYDFEVEEVHNYIVNGGLVVHNSMLGLALAELLPRSELKDIIAIHNDHDENAPLIKTVTAGNGREEVQRAQLETREMFKNQNFLLMILAIIALIAPWWVRHVYKSDIMFAAFFLGGMLFLAATAITLNMGPRMLHRGQAVPPKLIVDNFSQKHAPFYDATGSHAGALLGDVLHDPFQSGGLGTPANQRIVAGLIHKANGGVLFVDEVATLDYRTQQELLSAIQEKKFPITGQSERSAGAMVRTEPVPCDFVMVAAGNLETIKQLHPALRSRIRGYGYEVFLNETMVDTKENRWKIARFVAQEVKREEGKIPHFTRHAVLELIHEARRRANRKGHLTLHLRGLGGLVRAAGDLAKEEKAELADRVHVRAAKKIARPLEQQIADQYIERKKEYEVIITTGSQVGRVNGLAVIGSGSAYSGILLPIEAAVTPGGKQRDIIATGKLGDIAKEAVKNVSAIIMDHFGEDIKETKDIFVQFLQTHEGVEGDSASIAVATAIISALKNIPIKQNVAMTGSLSVRGEVLPIGGVSSKVEAAIEAGMEKVLVPKSNVQDIILDTDQQHKITVIPVQTIEEVLYHALEWKGHQHIFRQIQKKGQRLRATKTVK